VSQQRDATVHVTHYFDVERVCRRCGSEFIFTAAEQQHWYEVLGFNLWVDRYHCKACGARARGLTKARARYEELFHVGERTPEQALEMARASLDLIEAGIFSVRQLERVRMLLRGLPASPEVRAARARTKALAASPPSPARPPPTPGWDPVPGPAPASPAASARRNKIWNSQ
jgi:hypothetical protein